MSAHTLELPGGQTLEYIVAGDGPNLVVYHHGTPAAGPIPSSLAAAAADHGFTIAEVVRPGYGVSTRHSGRSVADVVPLALAVADALGHERFATIGWSGGGPHALATAALARTRCVAALSLAGVAPYDADGLDFLAGMGEDNIEEFGAALAGASQLQDYLTAAAEGLRAVTGADLVAAMGSLLPPVDRAHLAGETGEELAEELRFSVANGIWGWYDDDVAFTQPWGFDLASLGSGAHIWQGSDDLMVPFAHGQWLAAHIAGAAVSLLDGQGHLSLAEPAFQATLPQFASALAR
ncbi:MAG: alpha/beta hydrolase [Actinomycetales bacterium]|nr:alpha/beta hydrolase [Actinomycetales bacterium]